MIFRLTPAEGRPLRMSGHWESGAFIGSVATYPSLSAHCCALPLTMRSELTYGAHARCLAHLPWPELRQPTFRSADSVKARASVTATPVSLTIPEAEISHRADDIAPPSAAQTILLLADSKRIAVLCGDDYRDSVKVQPGAQWSSDLRAWVIPFCMETVERLENLFAYEPAAWRSPAYQAMRDKWWAEKVKRRYAHLTDLPIAGMRTELWGHQRQAFSFVSHRTGGLAKGSAMLAMAMGVGKSATAIAVANNADSVNNLLILCPRAVVGVWPRQFSLHSERRYHVVALRGPNGRDLSVADKRKMAEQGMAEARAAGLPLALVLNFDSAWRPPLGAWLLRQGWDIIISDESHRHKNAMSKIGKFMADLRPSGRLRLALTGTPLGDKPLDLFGQARFLDPKLFGSAFTAFRDRFAIMDPYIPGRVARYRNLDQFHESFYSLAYHADESVVALPERTHTTIPVPFEAEARRHYDTAKRDFFLELGDKTLDAANAAVLALRLHQICNGRAPLKDAAGAPIMTTISAAKKGALVDLLTDLDEPVVVFARFHTDLDQIREAADSLSLAYGEVSGRRSDLTLDGTYPPAVRVLGVQVQSGGVGVDLSAASVGIYFGLDWSLTNHLQSIKRLHRPGSIKPVRILHLSIENSIDETIVAALEHKANLIDSLMNEPASLLRPPSLMNEPAILN